MAKGYSQKEGIDFSEVFSPVVRHTSIRVSLSIVAAQNLELEQMDVKTVFLHRHLEERIYMEQPPNFRDPGSEGKIFAEVAVQAEAVTEAMVQAVRLLCAQHWTFQVRV